MSKVTYDRETYDVGSKAWKQSEEVFLQENYDKMTAAEIGEKLGRSKHAIQTRRLPTKCPY